MTDPLVIDVLRDPETYRDPHVMGRYIRRGVEYDFTPYELDQAINLMLDKLMFIFFEHD